jgi:Cu(I)/Ag(I) efflux system membrane fusion protein
MKHLISIAVSLALAVGGGYWLGQRGTAPATQAEIAATKPGKKLLYYRNPMGLPDTSPVPKKDNMGMDYIPVYEGEEAPADGGNVLNIGPDKVQKLGVRTEAAAMLALEKTVRASGKVAAIEGRVFAISPRFEGWIERLHVNAVGQPVAKGQTLFEVYSPDLVSAQREYAVAVRGLAGLKGADSDAQSGMKQLAEAALLRLKNWEVPQDQISALEKTGEAKHSLSFRSPVSGVVTERKALQGMRFASGETLYQVADLSSVWLLADVAEQDIGSVRAGSQAKVRLDAYPGKVFEGKVDYVYPTLQAETRSVQVRVVLANPGGLLKPAMYAQVELPAGGREPVLTVPTSAVIDSGTRQVVLVQVAEGKFEPRPVKLGQKGGEHVAVLEGLAAGEKVVVNGNFLIDAESNLKAALSGLGQPEGSPAAAPKTVGHHAEGRLEDIALKAGTVSVHHQPIPSLKWPAMTMDFVLANPSLVAGIKPGAQISIEIVERKPGEWVITSLKPQGQ